MLWRLDSRWNFHNHHGVKLDRDKPSEYLRENLYVVTSGVCSAPPLLASMQAIGADHILFGTDYPFESMEVACRFLETAPVSEIDREKISFRNAERILNLGRCLSIAAQVHSAMAAAQGVSAVGSGASALNSSA